MLQEQHNRPSRKGIAKRENTFLRKSHYDRWNPTKSMSALRADSLTVKDSTAFQVSQNTGVTALVQPRVPLFACSTVTPATNSIHVLQNLPKRVKDDRLPRF